MGDRHARVVNIDEVKPTEVAHGRFGIQRRGLGNAAGGQKLGCSYYEQPPGKAAFPFHFHLSNEEAIYVLEGEVTLRIGAERVTLRAGDYVAIPVGAEHAHQLINESSSVVRYLAMSTMQYPEVVQYPDSKKLGAMGPGIRAVFKQGTEVEYYDGED
jgi:uncharacterized cupin superfamily protein